MDYLLTPWCRVLLEKLIGLQLVKKFLAFHETRRFITALTSVRHLSLSWASPIQSIYPHPTSWRSIIILISLCMLRDDSPRTPSPEIRVGEQFISELFCLQSKHPACECFLTKFFTGRGCKHLAQPPKLEDHPCPRLLIQFIRSYPPYRRPFLHPQPEDTPCRGDGPTAW